MSACACGQVYTSACQRHHLLSPIHVVTQHQRSFCLCFSLLLTWPSIYRMLQGTLTMHVFSEKSYFLNVGVCNLHSAITMAVEALPCMAIWPMVIHL